MNLLTHIATLLYLFSCIYAQRVPPGVNPNHYQQQQQFQQQPQYQQQQQQFQQQPQYQQQQQQPPQYQQQQVPIQQQQVPVQPQVQVPQGHVPVQQGHPQQVHPQQGHPQQGHQQVPHHGHHQQGKILDAQHIMQEKEHIAEHMEIPMDTSKMTEQELQFHYFKMHDADNNNKLDGCELIKSLIHWHGPKAKEEHPAISDEELERTVDEAMKVADINRDGFIDYREYRKAA
ncbi:lymphotoxin beta receptor inhibitor isoform X2 [Onthophagus taurus]|uniref:lymphotoxin beta receptor inhibitor isoform X2 n=1 Tax=Onthophagus taurus TaxID=166361 RepID=UPI000C2026C3|nr:putative cyclin-dependent serine/threonine-protein kinase DDB_G0272797/DDB_G0274007 isoform X2 [Onthophagus taurus]